MRILHTCLRYPPASGGAEVFIQQLVERTRNIEEGRDVRVLTSKMRTHSPISELDPELLVNDPPYIQRLHHLKTPIYSYPRLQALPYYINHHTPDILQSYGFWYQPADVTASYARKHSIPFFFFPIYYENKNRQKKAWQLYKKLVGEKTFAAADIVFCISPFEQQLIESAEFPVKRFELLSPGIDESEFERDRLNPFIKRKIRGKILLTVSRIAPGKGLEDAIRALPDILKSYPDAQLVLAGEDFGALSSLTKLAHSLGVATHTHFTGKLSREELIGAFQHADVFIHPSYYEAFGIVVAEAAIAGAPVIARNTSAIPYATAPDYHDWLFESTESLTNNVVAALAESENHKQLRAQHAKAYVRENFSWDAAIHKLMTLYGEYA